MALGDLFVPKFQISAQDAIATAGSCFASHLKVRLPLIGINTIDLEPPPLGLTGELAKKFGYGIFSARYGNIYTARQFLRLIEEATGLLTPNRRDIAWERNGRWWDALRPGVEPNGLDSLKEVQIHREFHLSRVRRLLMQMDVFVFTLGLTEAWLSNDESVVFPIAPGVIAGRLDPAKHFFHNFNYGEITEDLKKCVEIIKAFRSGKSFRMILTVSPVPLAATYTGQHVLVATMASKSVLRSAAQEVVNADENIDYFPSFEIVSNPWIGSNSYLSDQRNVSSRAINTVMEVFRTAYALEKPLKKVARGPATRRTDREIECEELLYDIFARRQ